MFAPPHPGSQLTSAFFRSNFGRRLLFFNQFQRFLFVDQLPFAIVTEGGAVENQFFSLFRRERWINSKQFTGQVSHLGSSHLSPGMPPPFPAGPNPLPLISTPVTPARFTV